MTKKLNDNVLHRVVQILQEALLTGVDVSDLMRQIRLVDGSEPGTLDLCPKYVENVAAGYAKMQAEAEALQAARNNKQIIMP